MSGKLLKICTAVMLVTGMGDVMCQGGDGVMDLEAGPSYQGDPYSQGQRLKKRKWEDSASARVLGYVQASVKISCDGREQELRLFNDDGTETPEENRTFRFSVKSVSTGGTVSVRGEEGMVYDSGGEWKVFLNGQYPSMDQRPFVLTKLNMYDGSGRGVTLDDNNSLIISRENAPDERSEWKIILKPLPLNADSVPGVYAGKLSVVVSANS